MSKTPFRRLLELFQARFFENDTVSPDGGFETNIWQVLGFLATPGFLLTYLFMPQFLAMATKHLTRGDYWALRMFRLFFPAFSFAVVGFAAFFQWEKLFPERRDFLILGTFPVRLTTLFAAKFSALCLFLVMLIGAINFFPNVMGPLLSFAIPEVRKAGFLRVAGAQAGSAAGASLFAFFAVAAFQGLLINVTSPRIFRRISPWIQMAGMSLTILALLMFPVYSMLLPSAARTHAAWLWFFPPIWFAGLYDILLTPSDPLFASLGRFGGEALGVAIAAFCVTWALGFRRHYRRTLEAEDSGTHRPRVRIFDRLSTSPLATSTEARAIFRFSGSILARSATHRLFLACYWSVGIAIGLLVTVTVEEGHLALSPDGVRGFPLLVVFFVVSGLRAGFQFPAELASNWLFRITEERWAEKSRRACRMRVLASGLLPALLLFLPFEMWRWGGVAGLFHIAFQLATGALLIEVLFWSFDKVPFTCSYFPGKLNLALLFGIYLYGFTEYSFRMSDLELSLEGRVLRIMLFFAGAAAMLALFWRRSPRASEVRFDGNEPEIQPLNLT
jgi:hypothetical protein